MAKKKRKGPSPKVFRRITRTLAKQYVVEQRAGLYVGPSHCNPHDREEDVVRFDSRPYVESAHTFDDLSLETNRHVWCGSLGETALQFIINEFRNQTGYGSEPHFYVLDLRKMAEITAWGDA